MTTRNENNTLDIRNARDAHEALASIVQDLETLRDHGASWIGIPALVRDTAEIRDYLERLA